jgi:hypothetical protein
MRKISRAEENYTSLNFRTANVKPWGQEEHFRIVDSDTPVTEGGPRCEGCGGALQDYRGGSICRNRACDKRDMLFNVKAKPQIHTVHPYDSSGFLLFPEQCTNPVHTEGFDNSDQHCPECGDNHINVASKTASDKPWDDKDPDGGKHHKLSPEQKEKAKARAKSHGRPYPNWVDNAWASKN